jgi:hypothetical protein
MDLKSTRKQSNKNRFTKEKVFFYIHFVLTLLYVLHLKLLHLPPLRSTMSYRMLGWNTVAGVLDELYSQLTPLSGVAVLARQFT